MVGHTGQGKSTLTASLCAAGCAVLSDDYLLVRENDGGFDVYPTYAGLRLWPDSAEALGIDSGPLAKVAHYTDKVRLAAAEARYLFCGEPRRLGWIFVLCARTDRADEAGVVSITPLSPREAFSALIRCMFRLDTSSHARLEREFDLLTCLVPTVPVRRLEFQKGLEHLEAFREAVLADAASALSAGGGRDI